MHNRNGFSQNPDKYEGFEDLFDENDKQTGRETEVNKPNSLKKRETNKDPKKPNGMGGHAGRTPNYPNPQKK